jgi:cell shape-determining protein MreC
MLSAVSYTNSPALKAELQPRRQSTPSNNGTAATNRRLRDKYGANKRLRHSDEIRGSNHTRFCIGE